MFGALYVALFALCGAPICPLAITSHVVVKWTHDNFGQAPVHFGPMIIDSENPASQNFAVLLAQSKF